MERVPIPNFEDYEITKEGLVTKNNVPMKMHIYSGRTPSVRLRNEDGFHSISVSKLVLLTFVGEPEYPSDIPAYKDGNNHNYHLSNLEWATRSKAYAKLYKKNNRYYEKRVKGVVEALGKPIAAYKRNDIGELIKHSEYESISAAARVMEVATASIARCLESEEYTCKGYIWKEIEKETKND